LPFSAKTLLLEDEINSERVEAVIQTSRDKYSYQHSDSAEEENNNWADTSSDVLPDPL